MMGTPPLGTPLPAPPKKPPQLRPMQLIAWSSPEMGRAPAVLLSPRPSGCPLRRVSPVGSALSCHRPSKGQRRCWLYLALRGRGARAAPQAER